jgi:hypothetical protein
MCHGSSQVYSMGEHWVTWHGVRAARWAGLGELQHGGAHSRLHGSSTDSWPASGARQQAVHWVARQRATRWAARWAVREIGKGFSPHSE